MHFSYYKIRFASPVFRTREAADFVSLNNAIHLELTCIRQAPFVLNHILPDLACMNKPAIVHSVYRQPALPATFVPCHCRERFAKKNGRMHWSAPVPPVSRRRVWRLLSHLKSIVLKQAYYRYMMLYRNLTTSPHDLWFGGRRCALTKSCEQDCHFILHPHAHSPSLRIVSTLYCKS
jgi:hypothetical protein